MTEDDDGTINFLGGGSAEMGGSGLSPPYLITSGAAQMAVMLILTGVAQMLAPKRD